MTTTAKIKFRASSVKTNEGTLFYQVIHYRVARQAQSVFKLYSDEWDERISEIIMPANIESGRKNYLLRIKAGIAEDVKRIAGIITRLERTEKVYTADRVMEIFTSLGNDGGLISFGKDVARHLKQIGKIRTAETYLITLSRFSQFRKEMDIPLDEVDSNLMME